MLELVIFDCDGVLVDSERIAIRVESEVLTEMGWAISEHEVAERFVGRSAASMHAELDERFGGTRDWDAIFTPRYREAQMRELAAVPGVEEVIDVVEGLGLASCVASSSTRAAIDFKLAHCGLSHRFGDRIVAADDVEHAKPAPDVFLAAAAMMSAEPAVCVVIEDSAAGVEAARAARMPVLAYGGGVTPPERLAGADSVHATMQDIARAVSVLATR